MRAGSQFTQRTEFSRPSSNMCMLMGDHNGQQRFPLQTRRAHLLSALGLSSWVVRPRRDNEGCSGIPKCGLVISRSVALGETQECRLARATWGSQDLWAHESRCAAVIGLFQLNGARSVARRRCSAAGHARNASPVASPHVNPHPHMHHPLIRRRRETQLPEKHRAASCTRLLRAKS